MLKVLKKKRVWVSGIALILASVSIFFVVTACNSDPLRSVMRHVSEIQESVWTGGTTEYGVAVVTGKRENPYQLDGVSQNNKANFTVITLTPKVQVASTQTFTYTLTAGTKNYTGTFVANPFGSTYFADLNQLLDSSETVGLRITSQIPETENVSFDVPLTNQNTTCANCITAQEALSIAHTEFAAMFEDTINFEILVKFVSDPLQSTNKYFWYVALVDKDSNYNAILIHPDTKEIVAKKTSN